MHLLLDTLLGSDLASEYLPLVFGYFKAGGWLLIPLAMVCFLIWFRYIHLRCRLKASLATPSGFVSELKTRLHDDGCGPPLLNWLSTIPGAKARMVHHLLPWIQRGLPFREGFLQCRNAELGVFNQSLSFLAALVVAAPLLGLLGTVFGMIGTFEAVAHRTSETTMMVAGGISQALITTQVGLVAALPGTFGIVHLSHLYKRMKSDLEGWEAPLASMLEETVENDRVEEVCSHELAQ